jgi:hypothetical protein
LIDYLLKSKDISEAKVTSKEEQGTMLRRSSPALRKQVGDNSGRATSNLEASLRGFVFLEVIQACSEKQTGKQNQNGASRAWLLG